MAPLRTLVIFLLLLLALVPALSRPDGGGSGFYDPARVTQLSWRPRAFLYSGFLSHDECDHLVNLAKGRMEKSMVADNDSGKSIMSQVRTSSGTFLSKHEDDIVAGIEKRVAAWTFLPEENAESIQILHYELGQKYDAHFDYFHDKNNLKRGGHRVATVLMYLTDVKKGGETVFPNAAGRHLQLKDETWSDCARSGLAVKPKKGDALLFFSLHVNATTDPASLHGSCPVIEGEKWSATKWIHVRSFDNPPDVSLDLPCSDENERCTRWAAVGECYRNPKYMVGTKDSLGFCRKSCGTMEMRRLLVLFALLSVTAVVPVFLWPDKKGGASDVAVVVAAPPFNASSVTIISWKPRIFFYKGFLSDDECDHLVKLGKEKLKRSMVADNESGKSVMSEVRTSSGMFLDKQQDPVVSGIEERIAAWTLLPQENAENIQILRYENGQKYDPHFDYFQDKVNQLQGGHRYATVLTYLSTVEKGGETVFPNAEGWESQPKDDSFSDCAKKGLAVKAVKGDSVLFFNLQPDGTPDPLSLHGSCPVIEGEKWSAPKWIHVRSYDNASSMKQSEECSDLSENCAAWAASGECDNNAVYMIGTEDAPGQCQKSCNACSL
uniref:procollagen-proline 4-dioxygenase n=2 Tax=Oryza TaxID=4527 RepID=A0A0D3FQC2_9ORYZ